MVTDQDHSEPSRSIDSSDTMKTLVVRLSLGLELLGALLGVVAALYRWM